MLHDAKVLRRAAELVAQGWCQGHYAEDAEGTGVGSASPNAVKWCLQGAVHRAASELGVGPSLRRSFAVARSIDSWDAPAWNDAKGRTADEVESALYAAAAHVEAEGAGR
jgi:hypothetical protein